MIHERSHDTVKYSADIYKLRTELQACTRRDIRYGCGAESRAKRGNDPSLNSILNGMAAWSKGRPICAWRRWPAGPVD